MASMTGWRDQDQYEALHDFADERGCAVARMSDASYEAWQPESEKHEVVGKINLWWMTCCLKTLG